MAGDRESRRSQSPDPARHGKKIIRAKRMKLGKKHGGGEHGGSAGDEGGEGQ